MQRPDRIGTYTLGDFDKAISNWTQTTLAAIDQADNTYGGVVNTLVTLEDYVTDNWKFSNAGGFTFVVDTQFGIGNAVKGLDPMDNHMFSISGNMVMRIPKDTAFTFQFMCGRLSATPSKTVSVSIPNPIFLPVQVDSKIDAVGDVTVNASVNTVFVQQSERDGGVLPTTFPDDYYDLFFGFRIVNGKTGVGSVTVADFNGQLSIYKYKEDLMTYDPNR